MVSLISSQVSQMRITVEKLAKSKKNPILIDAATYLNQEAYDIFSEIVHGPYLYHLSIQLDGSVNISREN